MLDLDGELRGIAAALEAAEVRYAVAGGLAVSIYTTPRATEDIDLVVEPADVERAVAALARLGFRSAARPMHVAGGELTIQRLTKIEGTDLLPLDLLVVAGSRLGDVLGDRLGTTLEDQALWVVSRRALGALKRLRGSTQDLADLEALGED